MPLILGLPAQTTTVDESQLQRVSVLATARVGWQRVSVPVTVRTEQPLHHTRVYAAVRTQPRSALIHPDVLANAEAGSAVVTHRGLPAEAISYSIRSNEGREGQQAASLDVTLLGRVPLSGGLTLSVSAGGQAAAYGPFGALNYTYELTPTGWTTQATSADMSGADAQAGSPYMTPFEEEFLPWERERDLTPYEQALKARQDALVEREWRIRERAAREAKRPFKRPEVVDMRAVAVRDVIHHALEHLGLPFVLTAPIPPLGYYYAATETHRYWDGAMIIGTSYQTKGKTPVQVLEDILGPLGWRVEMRFGLAHIGPPEELLPESETAALLGVPEGALTGVRQEVVNPEAAQGEGNRALPSRITLEGATLRRWLPPIPPDPEEPIDPEGNPEPKPPPEPDPEEDPENDPERGGWPEPPLPEPLPPLTNDPSVFARRKFATLYQRSIQRDGKGEPVLIRESWLIKMDGKLFLELMTTNGWRRAEPGYFSDIEKPIERWDWGEVEGSYTVHVYEDPNYDKAETITRKRSWKWSAVGLRRHQSEEELTYTQWHPEGWQWRRAIYRDVRELVAEDATGTATYWNGNRDVVVQREGKVLRYENDASIAFEEWVPIDETLWHHLQRRREWRWFAGRDPLGQPLDPQRVVNFFEDAELTDQGPPQAPENPQPEPKEKEPEEEPEPDPEGNPRPQPEPGTPEDETGPDSPENPQPGVEPDPEDRREGFPYDTPISKTIITGGRGDPQTVRIPTALELPDIWVEQHLGRIRRAQTLQRTTYRMVTPPDVESAGRIKSYSVSGAAGSLTAEVLVEEAYVPTT